MLKILIVEADKAVQMLIESRLGRDFAVESATGLQAALNNHDRNSYDVVVWDAVSAASECSNPVRILKKFLKNHVGTKAIVLSDVKEPPMISLHNLRCDWLQKPFSPPSQRLTQTITNV